MVHINIYEDITNDDVILIGNSGGYIDKIKFIKLAQNTDYNAQEICSAPWATQRE